MSISTRSPGCSSRTRSDSVPWVSATCVVSSSSAVTPKSAGPCRRSAIQPPCSSAREPASRATRVPVVTGQLSVAGAQPARSS
ncbi:MAG: hypothetical protein IPG65_13350 [Ottowia sp.]|nr:hypothetical protein [Ottowia sp.]